MLKLGEQNISGLYLGGEKIEKAYLGETLVFSAGKPSRLPDGYTEVEYVATQSGSTVSTNIYATNTQTRVELDFEPIEFLNSEEYLFCAFDIVGSTVWKYALSKLNLTKMKYYAGYMSSASYGIGTFNYRLETGKRITVDFDAQNKVLKIEDNTISISPPNMNESVGTLRLSGFPKSQNWATLRSKIYSAKVYVEGTLEGDFVPCKSPSGVVGLYNLTTDEFVTDSTSTLIAGPAV